MRGEAPCGVSRHHSGRERLGGSIGIPRTPGLTRRGSPRTFTRRGAWRLADAYLEGRDRPFPTEAPTAEVSLPLMCSMSRADPKITSGGRGIAPLERRMRDAVGFARSVGESTNSGPVVGRSLVEGTRGGPGLV